MIYNIIGNQSCAFYYRTVALGFLSVFNRVGGIMAPQIVNLNNIYHNSHFVMFGMMGILAGFLGSVLPETLGKPLPDTPDEIYAQVKKLDSDVIKMKVGSADNRPLLDGMDEDEERNAHM